MKRTFLKVLPFAAALLLATSCSKDENNSVDEIVNGGEQTETVVKTFKTITVKGKVNKSISKVTTNDAGTALAFEGTEVFAFGSNTDDVYGTINFTKPDGSYTATVNYTDEQYLNGSFIATLGTNHATISAAYDNLAAAVKNAYYTINFSIVQENEEYKLKSGETDLVVNLQSAFIEALGDENTSLGSTEINVAADKFYVVPVGKTMGGTSNKTVAGKIYSLGTVNGIKYREYSFDESSMQTSYTVKTLATGTYTELTNANPGSTTWTAGNWYVVSGNNVTINQRIQISGTGDVHLILKDGATLNAAQGIQHATDGNSLIIYGQSQGTGILNANTTKNSNNAAIGGNGNQGGASVTIHGGNVNASGYVGIGGCWNGGLRGTLTVYNGTVNATGLFGAGIGTGACSWVGAGTVLVYGGSINAIGGEAGAGIGGGRGDAGATVKVYAGHVKAIGGGSGSNAAAGIGGGRYDSGNSEHNGYGGTLEIYGGIVEAYGQSRGIGCGGPLDKVRNNQGHGTLTVSGSFDVVAGDNESSATATTIDAYKSNRLKYVKISQK